MYPTAQPRSQAQRPGAVYVPVQRFTGVEVMAPRFGVQVSKHTIHGSAAELRQLAAALLRAASQDERVAPQA